MKNKLEEIGRDSLYWVLAILPAIITLLVLPAMPDIIPAHYGAFGQVDRYGSKYELFILPMLTLVFALFMKWFSKSQISANPHNLREEKKPNEKAVNAAGYSLVAVFNVMTYIFLYTSFHSVKNLNSIGYNRMIAVVLCLMYIVIGNYLPKCKRNALVGIRVSWTLDNDEVWFRTHRFGGKVFMIGGLISAICCIFVPESFALAFTVATVLILTVIVCVYAHNIFYKLKNEK